jgi:hypothetical protein
MRISELLQLQVDCLTQDARGVHYLRYMQGKVKRENAVPISYIPRFSDTISQHFSTSLAQVAADSSAAERYCWGEMLKRRSTVSCGSLSLS